MEPKVAKLFKTGRSQAMRLFRKKQEETHDMLERAFGQYGPPTRPLEEVRREAAKKLKGISVSDMIIEERS